MDSLNFFKEITAEQLGTYAPGQIATILRQRENVKTVIEKEYAHKEDTAAAAQRQAVTNKRQDYLFGGESSRATSRRLVDTPEQWEELSRERPWVPRLADECQYKVCPNCRPACADRVYIGLDAVVNDDIPATAATGFGFHLFGRRPVCDVSVLSRASQLAVQVVSSGSDLASSAGVSADYQSVETAGDACANIFANGPASSADIYGVSRGRPRSDPDAKWLFQCPGCQGDVTVQISS